MMFCTMAGSRPLECLSIYYNMVLVLFVCVLAYSMTPVPATVGPSVYITLFVLWFYFIIIV